MVEVKLPDIMSGALMFENVLSIRVLEWLVILVGCKIKVFFNWDSQALPGDFNTCVAKCTFKCW